MATSSSEMPVEFRTTWRLFVLYTKPEILAASLRPGIMPRIAVQSKAAEKVTERRKVKAIEKTVINIWAGLMWKPLTTWFASVMMGIDFFNVNWRKKTVPLLLRQQQINWPKPVFILCATR